MIKAVRAHPGVFIGGMITYAVVVHFLVPRAPALSGRMPAKSS